MSTADKLNALIQTKADIKQALIDKGQNPTDVFSTYADDIRAIETGGGGRDWTALGYSGEPTSIAEGYDYALYLLNNQDDLRVNDFENNKQITYLPNGLDWHSISYSSNKTQLFANSSIEYVDILDLSKSLTTSTTFQYTTKLFYKCTNLKNINKIILADNADANATDFTSAFEECTSLKSIGSIEGKITNLKNAFYKSGIEAIPEIDTSLCTNMNSCFCYSNIKEADLSKYDLGKVTDFYNMFYSCGKLEKVIIPSNNIFSAKFFYGCYSLSDLTIPDGWGAGQTDFSNLFDGCEKLPTEQLSKMDTSSAVYMPHMFYNFRSDSSDLDLSWVNTSNVTNLQYTLGEIGSQYINLTGWDTRKANISRMLDNINPQQIKIDGELSVYSTNTTNYYWLTGYTFTEKLRYITFKDIGENNYSINMGNLRNWGVEDETIPLSAGARQSLINSIITNSYDRVTNGLSAVNLILSANTKTLLTEDEIAQITAKGFTIA